jgi:hypothetical protein
MIGKKNIDFSKPCPKTFLKIPTKSFFIGIKEKNLPELVFEF